VNAGGMPPQTPPPSVCFSIVLPVKVKHTDDNFVERQEQARER
jgi:hypothetical protein